MPAAGCMLASPAPGAPLLPAQVAKMCLFNTATYSSKSMRLDEFEQLQVAATDGVANHLRDNWLASIKNIIRSGPAGRVPDLCISCALRPRHAMLRRLRAVPPTIQPNSTCLPACQGVVQGCRQGLVQPRRVQLRDLSLQQACTLPGPRALLHGRCAALAGRRQHGQICGIHAGGRARV